MKCPHDGTELTATKYEGDIEVDQCSQCSGMWLDWQELQRIEDAREKDYSAEIKQLPDVVGSAYEMAFARSKPAIQCPKCGREMERREHGFCSQVLVDTCPTCRGTWLDGGEIEALEVFFEKTTSEAEEVRAGFFSRLSDFFS
ncbi:TFIIB-type zinc ribbon-containing protein [Stieleria varia]|uniref:Transcription factor zinc-finger domain-containing protein n=1 Tax=Stieleria varia TaxID=2528005 RepID=A0A5C5ZY34_9BACT|nr:zf-TFIIB domain-containing protein [Stieleria varia]TWT92076.1 hypothetical protein Pla52n_63730 [Stieleria varia]